MSSDIEIGIACQMKSNHKRLQVMAEVQLYDNGDSSDMITWFGGLPPLDGPLYMCRRCADDYCRNHQDDDVVVLPIQGISGLTVI